MKTTNKILLLAVIICWNTLISFAQVNNNCSGAIMLTANAPCVNGTTIGSTADGPGDCDCCCFLGIGAGNLCVENDHDVWYKYTSVSTAAITVEITGVSGGGATDLGITIWAGSSCSGPAPDNELVCVDDNGDGGNELADITSGISVGNSYLIRIAGDGASDVADFCIRVLQSADNPCEAFTQPIQDGCNNVLAITRYNVSGSTSTFSDASTPCDYDGSNDVFFKVVAPASGSFTTFVNEWGDYNIITQANLTANLYEGACNSLSIAGAAETVNGNAGMDNPATNDCIDISQGLFNDVNNGPFIFENLTPGQDYYVRVTEEEDQSAWVELAFQETLLEDMCVDAQELSGTGCNYSASDVNEPDDNSWTGQAHLDGTDVNGDGIADDIGNCNTNWYSNENMVWYYFDITNYTPQPITITVEDIDCDNTGGGQLQMGIWRENGATCAPTGGATAANGLGDMIPVGCNVGTSGALSITLPDNMPNDRYYLIMDGDAGAQCTWKFVSLQLLAPCPLSDFVVGAAEALCSGDTPVLPQAGVDYTIADPDGTLFGAVQWFDDTDPTTANVYTPVAVTHSGANNCAADAVQTVYAFVQCDTDLNGVFDIAAGDSWVLVAQHSYQVYPAMQNVAQNVSSCGNTVTAACSDILGTAASPTGGAAIANWNAATGIYTAQPGDAAGTLQITVTSGIAGYPCGTSVQSISTPACAALPVCQISSMSVSSTTPSCNNDGTYSFTINTVGGPDASVTLAASAGGTQSGTLPATTANAATTYTYAIGTNATITVNDSQSLCSFGPFNITSPAADNVAIDYQQQEGDCNTAPNIILPAGYTCVYEFLSGTFAGTTGSGATAVYPAGVVSGNSGVVRFTVTTPCGLTNTVDVNFICVVCNADAGIWDN